VPANELSDASARRAAAVIALVLAALLGGTGAPAAAQGRSASRADGAPARAAFHDRDGLGLFTQPLGTLFMSVEELVYVPLGVNVPVAPRADLVVQASATYGNWYGCGSRSAGGWLSAGLAWFFQERRALDRGAFVQPTLIARYFDTSGARSSPAQMLLDACSPQHVENLDGADYELHVGVDAGYSMRVGMLEITPVIGASLGLCMHCIGGGALFVGPLQRYFDFYTTPLPRRTNRVTLGVNLNIVRLGVRF